MGVAGAAATILAGSKLLNAISTAGAGGTYHRKAVPPARPEILDDVSKEDIVALDPGESVIIGVHFRDFVSSYVAHCHQLAYEDHAMMLAWETVP